jgi:transcriptional/translational regulatory protein YebC/TACO1
MDVVLEAGAEDIDTEDDGAISVTTPWENLADIVAALGEAGLQPDHSEVTMVASTTVECDDDLAQKVMRLIDALEELDDVQEVYSNADFPASAFE